jgi:16S rRNA (adenine1518-N6/adenine1519-N6)-dimethyltransferase
MADLGSPKKTIEILHKYNFVFRKRFGQNFLIDTHVLDKIIHAAEITREDFVIEIGPGIGTLTQYLCENAGRVLAVEIDRTLMPVLSETLSSYDNVTVLNEDVMKLDLADIIAQQREKMKVKVVANLPYYITTPVIMGLFEKKLSLTSITVMVQKEVADRMQAQPGSKDYGALSLAVRYYCEPYIAAYVPPNCFMPRPKVGSAVICLKFHEKPTVEVRDEKLLFTIIRASFSQRRKTLVNALNNYSGLTFTREDITKALRAEGLPENIRGEALSLEQFARLSDRLSKI